MPENSEQIKTLIGIRAMEQGDESFVYRSWLDGYRASKANAKIRKSIYYNNQKKVIGQILDRSYTAIACDPNDPTHLYGYACFELFPEALVLHWIYTKYRLRHFGIARALIEHGKNFEPTGQLYASHLPANQFFDYLTKEHNIIYDPALKGAHGTN